MLACLALTACVAASPERQLLERFFSAARLNDNTLLAGLATVTFNPRTDGTIEWFAIVDVTTGQDARKAVMVNAQVRTPDGETVPQALLVTLAARDGRWMVSGIQRQ